MDTIDYLIRDLCEIPDRNSPDDQPEMLLVTAEEIRTAIERWVPAKDGERYRWLKDNRDVMLLTSFFGNGCINRNLEEVDAAIDAAMTANVELTGLAPEKGD